MPKMLPALPQAFGNLKDVFRSANLSLQGEMNPLGLPKAKNALVIMVDGLGWFNLTQNLGHLPYLKTFMNKSSRGFSAFPSTTAASIMSFASGVFPSAHGFIGYRIFDRTKGESVNLLTGLDGSAVGDYLRTSRLSDYQRNLVVVSKPEYAGTGFSQATFGDAKFIAASEIEARFNLALDELNSGVGKLIYLYVPELDQTAHRFGVNSTKWLNLVELLDALCKKLVTACLPNRSVILTADHGVIDVQESGHIFLDECPNLEELLDVGGDPRATFLYFKSSESAESQQLSLDEWLAGRGYSYTIDQLVDAGLYSSEVFNSRSILPDLVILAASNHACYHRGFSKPASMAMIGQHGGISDTEITIPVLRLSV